VLDLEKCHGSLQENKILVNKLEVVTKKCQDCVTCLTMKEEMLSSEELKGHSSVDN
jgi:hypothetical protein